MSKQVCEAIKEIDENVIFNSVSEKYEFKDKMYGAYCAPNRKGGKGECDSNGKILGSAFISLLEILDGVDDYEEKLKNDRLSEYAILWLCYKNNQNPNRLIGVDDIYNMLTRNPWFGKYYDSIKEKRGMMKIYFSYLNKLYALLKGICDAINKCDYPSNADECIKYANKCANLYQEYAKTGPRYHEYCNPYCNVLSNLKSDYDKFRETNNNKNDLPELKLLDGGESCESFCKSKRQKLNAEKAKPEDSKIVTSPTNSLSGQPSDILPGNQGYSLSRKDGEKNEYDSTTDKSVKFMEKLKDSLDGYPIISGDQRNLRNSLQGLEGGSNGQYTELNSNNGFETVGGISPITKISHGNVKKIIGLTQGLKGKEGNLYGQSDGLSGRTYRLSGLSGDVYGQSDGLSGQTYRLPDLEGDSNWQDSESNSHSGLNTIGGISPQMVALNDHMEDFPGEEDESLNTKHVFMPLKNESQNNLTTLEDGIKPPRKIKTLYFDNPLGYSKSNINDITIQVLNPIFNRNIIIYIVAGFISILIIFGISYKINNKIIIKYKIEKIAKDEKGYKFV
ncbi:CIR protein [Plasmodium chabaudi chabaudi]|uniref:CIR protein n=1 Tax=Plasmodium chabaudi chabaudi TaxID=31271 RepID=A0A4V0K063_PLACU|nr:CIR protein [Plasmodium chabaudi chabaudi]VTZ66331.1 CIR protein [Plasmodium chabaudi chabaudi]|eukprot:XP_016653046.1 CIR protein [Plasmodium chabaudi chabaudi]